MIETWVGGASGDLPEIISYFVFRLIQSAEVCHRHGLVSLLKEGNVRVNRAR